MIEEIIKAAKEYLPDLNEKRLREAFDFASTAHTGQVRKDGSPYITHPLHAAKTLTTFRVDEDTLIACLLHDVPEDTKYTIEDVEKKFGKKVAFLVNGITKLSKVHYRHDMAERQIESLKKLFIHSAQDPRIILIKLADRLHNMETIDAINKEEKRKRIAKETLEIFVPIANLLGIWELKDHLEDHCFRVLYPKEYKMIEGMVQESAIKKSGLARKTIKEVEKLMKKRDVPYIAIEGRTKTYFGIYKKMLLKGRSFHEIYDLIGIRIILSDVGTCYQTLGVLHQNFTPKIGRLKDYIAIPKGNGYQSIHTTVFGIDGAITEFQIRSYDMHLENEYGIAAHYFYREAQKSKKKMIREKLEKKYQWVQRILDLQRDMKIKSGDVIEKKLKLDIFVDRIFVFTPKGDVIDLPQGSTVIDFAYHIHSDVGMLTVAADINGKHASLYKRLKNGDTVKIVTSEEADGPQVEWLDHVQTNLSRNRIREFLKEKDRTTLITEAERLMNIKLEMFGYEGIRALTKLQKALLIENYELSCWEDVLLRIGNGDLDINDVIHVLFSEQELFGAKIDPENYVYEHEPRGRIEALQPIKVHKVCLCMEIEDRIGLLADISNSLEKLGVNILSIHTINTNIPGVFKLEFVVEIRDRDHYEKALGALNQVKGVSMIKRLHIDESNQKDPADVHRGHEQ